jgi:GDPmannose 4,6-dehydratase
MSKVSVVCGASGQDGYFLVRRLLEEGTIVYAVARSRAALGDWSGKEELHAVEANVSQPQALLELIASVQPDEVYNLAGQSSVSDSFKKPAETWQSNADFVVALLDIIRRESRNTRMYQASSTDMFGTNPGEPRYNERSRFNPQSPYASAKAAAHHACRAWRESFGVRVACGILANHESHRRRPPFLTRKIADHARSLRGLDADELRRRAPLVVGNLKVERDWGFAPDYVDGMIRILRQIDVRSSRTGVREEDVAANYRDYVLGTGRLTAVWELIDRAFALAGHELEWHLDGDDPQEWRAAFASNGATAVVVDPALFRPSDPMAIAADAGLARRELGWEPHADIDCFLVDMLEHTSAVKASAA